jgi:hypothetical protein
MTTVIVAVGGLIASTYGIIKSSNNVNALNQTKREMINNATQFVVSEQSQSDGKKTYIYSQKTESDGNEKLFFHDVGANGITMIEIYKKFVRKETPRQIVYFAKPSWTPDMTPIWTPEMTPIWTPDMTPIWTPEMTPIWTPKMYLSPYIKTKFSPTPYESVVGSHVFIYGAHVMELCTFERNMNLGLENFIPPPKENIFFPKKGIIATIYKSGSELSADLKALIGTDVSFENDSVDFRSNNTTYEMIKKSIQNERVFMYGKFNNLKFECNMMGTDPKKIVDKVYEDEEANNTGKMILSIGGFFVSVLLGMTTCAK